MVYLAKTLAILLTFTHLVSVATLSWVMYYNGFDVLNIVRSIVFVSSLFLVIVTILYLLKKKLGWWLITVIFPVSIIGSAINAIDLMSKNHLRDPDYWALAIFTVSLLLFVINLLPSVRKHFNILQK